MLGIHHDTDFVLKVLPKWEEVEMQVGNRGWPRSSAGTSSGLLWRSVQRAAGAQKKVLLPSHLPVDPRNKWDFKFGPLIFTSGPR